MASLNDCIDALAETIRTYSTARVYEYVPDTPTLDCVIVRNVSSEAVTFDRGFVVYETELLIVAGSLNEKNAQRWLNDQITGNGTDSVVGAIHEHPTLGTSTTETPADSAATVNASTLGFRNYGLVSFDGDQTRQWSAVVPVRLTTRGGAT